MNQQKIKIVLTGGGTGGHLFPLTAVAGELTRQARAYNRKLDLIFIGPAASGGVDAALSEKINVKKHNLITGKIRRYFSWENFVDIPKIFVGLVQSYFYFVWHMPDVIFSKGGYGSVPVVIMGWIFRIPIVLHESDSVAGLANRTLARFSKQIIVSFPVKQKEFKREKTVLMGNPVRDMHTGSFEEGIEQFRIQTQKPILLIIGGSQGAEQINQLVVACLKELTDKYEVIHQTGAKNYQNVVDQVQKIPNQDMGSYHPVAFMDERTLKNAYALAWLVITRAGAGAIFEVALAGKASLVIPLETAASGHQEQNAYHYEKAGACVVLTRKNLSKKLFLIQVDKLMSDRDKIAEMQNAALQFAKPNAARDIASLVLQHAE